MSTETTVAPYDIIRIPAGPCDVGPAHEGSVNVEMATLNTPVVHVRKQKLAGKAVMRTAE